VTADPSFTRVVAGAVEVDVLVVPRASRTRFFGVVAGRLKVQLSAPPVDGEANRALIELFAEALGVKKQAVEIKSGETGKRKTVVIRGVDRAMVDALGAA
jgi:uncharacterized protein (TIGR00251 family)